MATVITAGNATNGLSLSADNVGAFEFKTGTGAGTTALTLSSSQVATFAGNVVAPLGTLYPIVSGTAVASTSGTSIDFTSIPSWVKRITVMFNGVSTSGSSNPLIQIGSGSFTTSSYLSASNNNGNLSSTTGVGSTSGYIFASGSSANILYGNLIICNISGTSWTASHSIGLISSGSYYVVYGGGASPALSGALDRVRITTVNGTDTFDAGSINILYE